MALYIFVAGIILLMIPKNKSAKILAVFPTPSISHQVVFRPLTQELAKRGHEVTVITTDPAYPKGEAPPNLKEIDVHSISYSKWEKYLAVSVNTDDDNEMTKMTIGSEAITQIFEDQFLSEEVQKILKDQDKKFDLVLAEACITLAIVYGYVYKTPIIQISSFGSIRNYEMVGAPSHPILYPDLFRKRLYNLSMYEKITELYNHYKLQRLFREIGVSRGDELLKRIIGPDVPSVDELIKTVDMVFLNMHPIWEGNRPVPPNLIYLGGLHQKVAKELPNDLKAYLDSSAQGVVYISFGTNVLPSLIPQEKIQMFKDVFSKLPYNVLWKWDKDHLDGISENVKISKWFPQSDMLRHPNLKLFITQGGLQSTDEAITAGVPLIGIPLLSDQWYNVEKYVYHNIGVRLDLDSLTEDKFKKAIETVLGDNSYRKNIKRLHNIMIDQPQTPLQRAVWWTEHVLRHGNATHLRSVSANVSWAEYLELQLVSVLALVLFACLALVVTVTNISVQFLYRLSKGSVKAKVLSIRKIKSKRKVQ